MSPMRVTRHNKRDKNEKAIVLALARIGVQWVEGGPLDGWAVIGDLGWVPIEIKMPDGRLTSGQRGFIERCEIYEWPHAIWRSPEETIEFVRIVRENAG